MRKPRQREGGKRLTEVKVNLHQGLLNDCQKPLLPPKSDRRLTASSLASDSESALLYDVYVSAQDREVNTHIGQLCCWFRAINRVSSGLKWGGGGKGTQWSKPTALIVPSLTLNLLPPLPLTPSQ